MTIGIFDSGVGGLAVLSALDVLDPSADVIYVADQAYAPYGERTPAEITGRSMAIAEWLHHEGCETVVLACNTATAASIDALRERWPDRTFVGMEPAVKPAAEATRTGVVGVLATVGTLSAERYAALASRHSADTSIVHRIGHGLAMDVERGAEHDAETRERLAEHAAAFEAAGADVVVLGCTHYSFLAHELGSMGTFHVIDPADAVARRVVDVTEGTGTGRRRYVTTADGSERLASRVGGSGVERVRI